MKNKYEIRGDITAIFLNSPKHGEMVTLISTRKLERAKSYPNTWGLNGGYVVGTIQENKQREAILLHRYIMDVPVDKVIDHINHNTLNNTDENLREATNAENLQNKKGARCDSLTGIRGVMFDEKQNGWRAKVTVNGKTYFKRFKNKENAIKFVEKIRSEKMPFSKESGKLIGNIPDELSVNNSSGFRGVSWNNASQNWKATLKYEKKKYHLGYFKDPENAYNEILKKKQDILAL